MSNVVFFAWQSDIEERLNKRFIRKALDKAIKKVNSSLVTEDAIRAQQDTEGEPGSPDLAPTIFSRIEDSLALVTDITTVNRNDRRAFPNPNVLIEYGWGLGKLTERRVITVFNEAFGDWEADRPFDMRHKRKPCLYRLTAESSEDEKASELAKLVQQFEFHVRAIQRDVAETAPASLPSAATFEFARADYFRLLPQNAIRRMPGFWIGAVPIGKALNLGRVSQAPAGIWLGRGPLNTSIIPLKTMEDARGIVPAISPMSGGAMQTWERRGSYQASTKYFDDIVRLTIRSGGEVSLCAKTNYPEVPFLNLGWIMADIANTLRVIAGLRAAAATSVNFAMMIELRYDEHIGDNVEPVKLGTWRLSRIEDELGRVGPTVSADPKMLGPYTVGQAETFNAFLYERFVDLHELAERSVDTPIEFRF